MTTIVMGTSAMSAKNSDRESSAQDMTSIKEESHPQRTFAVKHVSERKWLPRFVQLDDHRFDHFLLVGISSRVLHARVLCSASR